MHRVEAATKRADAARAAAAGSTAPVGLSAKQAAAFRRDASRLKYEAHTL